MRCLCAIAVVAALAGCGPIQSTAVLINADRQLEEARTAGAPKAAPYEFARAEAYLRKAREEVGYSDYEVGVAYARLALELAGQAKDKAIGINGPPPGSLPAPRPPKAEPPPAPAPAAEPTAPVPDSAPRAPEGK